MTRREFVEAVVALVVGVSGCASSLGTNGMYGLIGKIRVTVGQRDVLVGVLVEGTMAMPGCLMYVVAKGLTEGST